MPPIAALNNLPSTLIWAEVIQEQHNVYCWITIIRIYISPVNDQYKLFVRGTTPLNNICLSMERTVLSLPFIFFRGLLCALCLKYSLYLFSFLFNPSLFLFPCFNPFCYWLDLVCCLLSSPFATSST